MPRIRASVDPNTPAPIPVTAAEVDAMRMPYPTHDPRDPVPLARSAGISPLIDPASLFAPSMPGEPPPQRVNPPRTPPWTERYAPPNEVGVQGRARRQQHREGMGGEGLTLAAAPVRPPEHMPAVRSTVHPSLFTPLVPSEEQAEKLRVLMDAARRFADVVDVTVPEGPRYRVMEPLRELMFWARESILRHPNGEPRPWEANHLHDANMGFLAREANPSRDAHLDFLTRNIASVEEDLRQQQLDVLQAEDRRIAASIQAAIDNGAGADPTVAPSRHTEATNAYARSVRTP